MICCEKIGRNAAVWSCTVCYNIFHLKCIRSWAVKNTSLPENSGIWRCPACNFATTIIPDEYRCFCGKVVNPPVPPYSECPHTCGQPCQRPCKSAFGVDPSFEGHPCTSLCHPGACEKCSAFVTRHCKCGKMKVPSQCSSAVGEMDCGEICGKTLSCGKHQCEETCHKPPCQQCPVTEPVACYCGNTIKTIQCDDFKLDSDNKFSCDSICSRKLSCGNHTCNQKCHDGPCPECPRMPSMVKTCPCGKNALADPTERKDCNDPIPTCEEICGKKLNCGGDYEHTCPEKCHDSECPPCKQQVSVRCLCGRLTERFVCSERPKPLKCVFRCNKKLSCRKHKCPNSCCINNPDDPNSHICAQPCNRLLSCGQHRCVQLCGHPGECPPCYNASFDELSCFCGQSVLYPPVPCGAKPPPCDWPCTREQPCSHPPNHKCHPDPPCPPCMELVPCVCIGGHKKMMVPCSTPIDTVSCGKTCDRRMPCGHKCSRLCHAGECTTQKCREVCQLPRQSGCGHPCAQYCHEPSPCPPTETTPCTYMVEYSCKCGLKTAKTQCPGSAIGLRNLQMNCDEMCARAERNRRLAEALQLDDVPVLPQAPITVYPTFIQETCQRQPQFALEVERALVDLVRTLMGKNAPVGTRQAHFFKPMPANNRRFIYELLPFYGLEGQSYDPEPNRLVGVYATSGKCQLPATSLTQSFPTAFIGVKTQQQRQAPPFLSQLPPELAPTRPVLSNFWKSNEAPQMELVQKAKKGKKEVQPSLFDDNGATEVTTLSTGAGQLRVIDTTTKSTSATSKQEVGNVPDHWDE